MSETVELTSIVDQITTDGSSGYKAEKDRYHLYVSNSCPFAHRVVVARALKGLQDVISIDFVNPGMSSPEMGWEFSPDKEGCTADTVNGKKYLREVYTMSHPEYKGRITVPLLFDKQTKKIVNTESAEILRMFSTVFNEFTLSKEQAELDFYPQEKREEIDAMMDWLNPNFITGVYHPKFAETQADYEKAVETVYDTLDKIEAILSTKRYLTGTTITEADIKLFVVLVRFDAVYSPLFKLIRKRIVDYKHIWSFVRDVYQERGVAETVNLTQIKEGYYTHPRYTKVTPFIPVGPDMTFTSPTVERKRMEPKDTCKIM